MKKLITTIALILCVSISVKSQIKKGIIGGNNWMEFWTNFKPKSTIYKSSDNILSGKISSNTTLTKKNTYIIIGNVYVTNNATLTIEPGTVIRGDYNTDSALIVTKGSKIIADGTESDPIIFTSNKSELERKSGDWGGIIILGNAPINSLGGMNYLDFNLEPNLNNYGGNLENDNSGILRYVRIEFAGKKLNATKELNGLSLAGVGNKTILENIQISYSNDDSFESYGGNVLYKNLISFRATDDDYDFTQGTQADLYNCIAIRYPFFSDESKSRCFEIDSYDKIENTDFSKKMTKIIANNITLLNIEDNNQGLIKEAIFMKQNSILTLTNSVISGFEVGILLEKKVSKDFNNLENLKIKNIMFNNCAENYNFEGQKMVSAFKTQFPDKDFDIETTKIPLNELFFETNFKNKPDYRIKMKIDFTLNRF